MSNPLKMAAERQKLLLEQAESIVYKSVLDGDDLKMHVYAPEMHLEGPPRPFILFFYSSCWDRGDVTQFAPHALYFAERGAICGLAEYRTGLSHGSEPISAMQDACSAIRWVRTHADKMNVDPEKVVASGARAGGHMAASASMNEDIPDDDPQTEISRYPNAVIIFSGIYELDKKDDYGVSQFADPSQAKQFSLSKHIAKGVCPIQMFHGTNDRMVSCVEVEKFAKKIIRGRSQCEFYPYEGRQNSFYNLNVDPVSYETVVTSMDDFLSELKILEPNENQDGARLISWREQDY